MDDSPSVGWVDELVRPLPLPLVLVALRPLAVHVGDQARQRDPEHQAGNIILVLIT